MFLSEIRESRSALGAYNPNFQAAEVNTEAVSKVQLRTHHVDHD
jgi:hypothetical protein